ncbi:hypothetical protein KAFR_0F00230 [Kazachstania africana CBS 2517]|uniref:DUF2421 domain-containing protein n=1 Tax=Kazachstania africana (strain ATCC 22294 / BCRC 22015 / CBS 2517 / CECT 1963 / NBRC 1671 / NRRL Y-8276) TaxID=1071382 RepID=H2AW70_KAZAF|nr:hypothetical protein KAFR_0F00230 [Kazachstania africana CBS 2517]CCF58620.1 hypothetical protein KAFR_0F00230 [Kazachstania africana CBS 2517]
MNSVNDMKSELSSSSSHLDSPQCLTNRKTKKSFTAIDHTKLNSIANEKKWNELIDYKFEELRDGFFTGLFANPESPMDTNLPLPPKSEELSKSYFIKSHRKVFLHQLTKKYTEIFKYFLAYLIAYILCVIHPVGNWLGDEYRYFIPLAVLLHHPARNVGVQLEITLESLIGGIFGVGWSSLAWYVSTSRGPAIRFQGALLFLSMMLALLISTWLRNFYKRLLYPSLTFGISIIYFHSVQIVKNKTDLNWRLYREFSLSYIVGMLISLSVNILIFPQSGNTELLNNFDKALFKIKDFLMGIVDKSSCSDKEALDILRKRMINSLNINLTEANRDFSNQFSLSKFDKASLRSFRNSLTMIGSTLRILPLNHILFNAKELEQLYLSINSHSSSAESVSAKKRHSFQNHDDNPIEILKTLFSGEVFALILEIIAVLDQISNIIKLTKNGSTVNGATSVLDDRMQKLKIKSARFDSAYKRFTKNKQFSNNLLYDDTYVNVFLFIKYVRTAAYQVEKIASSCKKLTINTHWRVVPPHYPFRRAMNRLPKECSIDDGSFGFSRYLETKFDVEDIFQKVYNAYTSKHTYERVNEVISSSRAIDHEDFNFHTTENPFRFKLWKLSTVLTGAEMQWSLKLVFVLTFTCLPGWLDESYHWYEKYHCWWTPIIIYILAHNKPPGQLTDLLSTLSVAIFAMFWGWAANEPSKFSNPYILCVFAGIIVLPLAAILLIYQKAKASFAAMISFTVISLGAYAKGEVTIVNSWSNCWHTSLALIIGIITSAGINWFPWSYSAREEMKLAVSTLLSHLSQSYQTVTERYLYHDIDDEPTDITLTFARIREVRLSQSIHEVKQLLKRAKREPDFVSNFDPSKYARLLDTCFLLLDKIIEARMAGSAFDVWKEESDDETIKALLSYRRDSAASVIFVLYILFNSFRSENRIPMYLPSTILARKRLFAYLSKIKRSQESSDDEPKTHEELHWAQVYSIAFSKSFTDVSDITEELVQISRGILGE